MIPNCLNLDSQQLDKLKRFTDFLQTEKPQAIEEASQDVGMSSYLTFKIFATGIGDCIWCEAFGFKCCLSINDDNEILPDEW